MPEFLIKRVQLQTVTKLFRVTAESEHDAMAIVERDANQNNPYKEWTAVKQSKLSAIETPDSCSLFKKEKPDGVYKG